MADAVLAAVQPLLQEVAGFPLYVQVLVGVAALWAARWALCLAGLFFKFFLRPAKRVQQFGAWGVVTGATDGIGKALAVELARKGMNLVLMSRTQKRLEEVRDEIVAKYPKVQVEVLAVDFNNIDDPSERAAISKLLARLGDIGVLFNNVGVSYDFPQFFEQLPANRVDSLIKLNVTSSTVMTQLVLPGMLERKRGVVVNVSSGSGRLRVPLLAQYSATKKYVEQFTLCLADETRAKGVHVQCHVPLFVTTKLAKIRHPTFLVPSPAVYARASVAFLGRDTLVSPYWPHALQIWIYENVPQWLASKFAMMSHLSLRKRALKKLAAKKTE